VSEINIKYLKKDNQWVWGIPFGIRGVSQLIVVVDMIPAKVSL
jgi:hypothetical protein